MAALSASGAGLKSGPGEPGPEGPGIDTVAPLDVAASARPVEASDVPARQPTARRGWVCDGSVRIEDATDRRWTVSKVSFLAEAGYERIVLHLDRAGSDRGGPASVTAQTLAAEEVARRFPNLQSAGVDRSAVMLDLKDGIRATLGLHGYRPRGLATLKAFSAFQRPNGSSRLLISTAGQGCFRLRIPAWSSTVTTGKAQIQLDVRP